MAVAYRSSAHTGYSQTSSITISKPSGVVQYDVLIAWLHIETSNTVTPSCSGWTLAKSIDGGEGLSVYLLWKIAGASEPSSYMFSWSGSYYRTGTIHAFSGQTGNVTGTSPFDSDSNLGYAIQSTDQWVDTLSIPSVSYTAGHSGLGIWLFNGEWESFNPSAPSGYTSRYSTADASERLGTRTDTAGGKTSGTTNLTETTFPNTINNGTFETNADGWESNGCFGAYPVPCTWARSTARAHSGSASLLVTWGTSTQSWCNTWNTYEFQIGERVRISAWVYVPSGSPDVAMESGFRSTGEFTSTKNAWVKITTEYTAWDNHLCIPGVRTNTSTAGQTCYVDDVWVEKVPEYVAVAATIVDSAGGTITKSFTDSAGLSDSKKFERSIVKTDSLGLTDPSTTTNNVSSGPVNSNGLSDTGLAYDREKFGITLFQLSDSVIVQKNPGATNLSFEDSTGLTDNASEAWNRTLVGVETEFITESFEIDLKVNTADVNIYEPADLTDSISITAQFYGTFTDSCAMTDGYGRDVHAVVAAGAGGEALAPTYYIDIFEGVRVDVVAVGAGGSILNPTVIGGATVHAVKATGTGQAIPPTPDEGDINLIPIPAQGTGVTYRPDIFYGAVNQAESLTIDNVELHTWGYNVYTKTGQFAMPLTYGEDMVMAGRSGYIYTPCKSYEPGEGILGIWCSAAHPFSGQIAATPSGRRQQFEDNMATLERVFTRNHRLSTIRSEQPDNSIRRADVQWVEWATPEVMAGGEVAEWSMVYSIPDTFWEDEQTTIQNSETGSTLPKNFDLTSFTGMTGVIFDAVLTVTGAITNPKITDAESGWWVQYTGTVAAGSSWVLDAEAGTSEKNGSSVMSSTTHGGGRGLFLVSNTFRDTNTPRLVLEGSGGDTNTRLTITARRKWVSA